MIQKKADFAIAFSRENSTVETEYKKFVGENNISPQLSQMSDVNSGSLIIHTGAEVKKFGGNEEEARGQCFIFLGAGIQMMRELMQPAEDDPPPPLLGWTIVGYRWSLFIAYGEGNKKTDKIYIYGPIDSCEISTRNYFEAFKLLRLMERVKKWARETFWEWYVRAVLDHLGNEEDEENATS